MALRKIAQAADSDLELDQIQGDVLVGLHKNVEAFFLFDIVDEAEFKSALSQLLDKIIFTSEIIDREQTLLALRDSNEAKPNFIAANILFSAGGLAKLTDVDGANFGEAFRRSIADRDALLKDPAAHRLPAFDETADGILLVTAADEPSLLAEVNVWCGALGATVFQRYFEIGRVRPDDHKGREHFGFMDGVSQPGIDGLTVPGQHEPGSPPGDPEQGLPGQDLIKPGAFVLGYTNEDGSFAEPPLPWMRNGSFMVIRRLEQQVQRFHSFLGAAAPPHRESAEKFGAQLVGRWPSGAPIMKAPEADDLVLAANAFKNNDFDFNADNHQAICPFISHIRKSYPRDDLDFTTPFPNKGDGEAFAETHRIIRAGIPFGFEVGEDPDHGPHEQIGNEASRGLMFVSYHSSIENGFEFIQTQWCNEPRFVIEKSAHSGGPIIQPGIDLIIGQTDEGMRFANLSSGNGVDIIRDVPPFVLPTGTGYFFAPSKSALKDVLTA